MSGTQQNPLVMQNDITVEDWDSSEFSSGRGKETLFKVVLRNQVDLISIADKKANMITSFNAIFISIIITLFGAGVPIQGIPLIERSNLVVPFSLLMVFCLISAVYAILAATPRITKAPKDSGETKVSLLFFGNFYQKSLKEYMKEMQELLKSKNSIYENLTIDIYYNGIVLNRKYGMLRVAYRLLMLGIVGFVGSFIIISLFEFFAQ